MVDEGKITPQEAVLRIDAKSLDQVLHPTFDTEALKAGEVIGEALPASPGAAAGKIVFTAEDAKRLVKENKKERVILVRLETSPEDIEGMHAAQGILTVRGGMTSHAASWQEAWERVVYPAVVRLRLMKRQKNLHWVDIHSMKEILFHWTVQPERYIKGTFRR